MATFKLRESGYTQAVVRRKGHPQQSQSFRTKTEATEWARKVESAMDRGEFKDAKNASSTTLRQVLEYYRDNRAVNNKGADVDMVRIGVLLDSSLAKYSMAALTADVIELWCNQRIKANKIKGSTINRYMNLLSAAINVGIRKMNLGIDNPCKLVDRSPSPQHRNRRIFGEEQDRLFAELTTGVRNIWLKPLVEFALETGMRRSELLALEWKFIDLKRGIAHLPTTKIDRGDEAPVSRDVPLSARAIEILQALPRNIDGKVFDTTSDAVKKGFSRAVLRARKKYETECKQVKETPLARMLEDLHFHDLRHEATSRLAKLYDMGELKVVGGWRNMNTLARYYNPTADELVEKMRRHEKK